MRKYLALLLLLGACSTSEQVVSKSDVKQLFSYSHREWLANIDAAVAANRAEPYGNPLTGGGMATIHDDRVQMVRLEYFSTDQRPEWVEIIWAFIDKVPEDKLQQVAQKATRQLAPTYRVVGTVRMTEMPMVSMVIEQSD